MRIVSSPLPSQVWISLPIGIAVLFLALLLS